MAYSIKHMTFSELMELVEAIAHVKKEEKVRCA